MGNSRVISALGMFIASAVVAAGTTGFATPPGGPPESSHVQTSIEVIDDSTSVVSVDIPAATGIDGQTEVRLVDEQPRHIAIDAVDATGHRVSDALIVENIEVFSSESFVATVRSETTGQATVIDTARAQQQVLPIIVALVGVGIKAALKIGSKAAIKEAAKKSVLGLSQNKWTHIMASKHNWNRLAKSKDQIAELMSEAMANGTRSTARNHVDFTWVHRGHTIVVRTSLNGHISNGWIK